MEARLAETRTGVTSKERKLLNGMRTHTTCYRLLDRVRITFWAIYVCGQDAQVALSGPNTPTSTTQSPFTTNRRISAMPVSAPVINLDGSAVTASEPDVLNSKAKRGFRASAIQSEIQYDVAAAKLKPSASKDSAGASKSEKRNPFRFSKKDGGEKSASGLFGRQKESSKSNTNVAKSSNGLSEGQEPGKWSNMVKSFFKH
jgi:hypothetical protein